MAQLPVGYLALPAANPTGAAPHQIAPSSGHQPSALRLTNLSTAPANDAIEASALSALSKPRFESQPLPLWLTTPSCASDAASNNRINTRTVDQPNRPVAPPRQDTPVHPSTTQSGALPVSAQQPTGTPNEKATTPGASSLPLIRPPPFFASATTSCTGRIAPPEIPAQAASLFTPPTHGDPPAYDQLSSPLSPLPADNVSLSSSGIEAQTFKTPARKQKLAWHSEPRMSTRLAMKRTAAGETADTSIPVGDSDDEPDIPLKVTQQARRYKKAKKEPSWPKVVLGYEDSMADLAVASSDGAEYKVSSVVMMATCSLFNDAMRMPLNLAEGGRFATPSSGDVAHEQRPPVEIAYPASTLALALNALHNNPIPADTSIAQIQDALDLAAFLGSTMLTDRLVARLVSHVRTSPWDVFIIASHLADTDLAKIALSMMYHDTTRYKMKVADLMTEMGEALSKKWALALCAVLHECPLTGNSVSARGERWRLISEKFSPASGGL